MSARSSSTTARRDPITTNVVCKFDLGVRLELLQLVQRYQLMDFNSVKFAAATMHMLDPRVTLLTFGSGKVVCTGAKSEEEARTACRRMVTVMHNMGVAAQMLDFVIENIVATASAGFSVELNTLYELNYLYCEYDPKLFPGARYRYLDPKLVFLVFKSGQIIISGAKYREQIEKGWETFYTQVLMSYRTATKPGNSALYARQSRKFIPTVKSIRFRRDVNNQVVKREDDYLDYMPLDGGDNSNMMFMDERGDDDDDDEDRHLSEAEAEELNLIQALALGTDTTVAQSAVITNYYEQQQQQQEKEKEQ